MDKNRQLELFAEFGSLNLNETKARTEEAWRGIFKPYNQFSLQLCECVNFTSEHQMPSVPRCVVDIPRDICCYYRLGNWTVEGVYPHFYTPDKNLIPFINDPYRHLERISQHKVILGLDISIKPEMPKPMKEAVSFYNKLHMAWVAANGIYCVPNVVVDPDLIEVCLDGYPRNSVICMNSSGIGKDKRAMENWQKIYPYVIDVLDPIHILRYGAKQPNEMECISTYYLNDNEKSSRYGRKWFLQ